MPDSHFQTIRDDEDGHVLAYAWNAPRSAVDRILSAPVGTGDGRSEWQWIRLANGDLALAVFPQGETYEACAGDFQFPEDAGKGE